MPRSAPAHIGQLLKTYPLEAVHQSEAVGQDPYLDGGEAMEPSCLRGQSVCRPSETDSETALSRLALFFMAHLVGKASDSVCRYAGNAFCPFRRVFLEPLHQ